MGRGCSIRPPATRSSWSFGDVLWYVAQLATNSVMTLRMSQLRTLKTVEPSLPRPDFRQWRPSLITLVRRLLSLCTLVLLLTIGPGIASALDLALSDVVLLPCVNDDPGRQPDLARPMGASCYVLTGDVTNAGRRTVVDTDVYARILDASGEPVLQNRTRVGSIGDVNPGVRHLPCDWPSPAGTPGPFEVRNPKARGFTAPVRSRAQDDDELLPLEQEIL